nr:NADH dehydrogenase subunit 4 [Hoplopleura edentula]
MNLSAQVTLSLLSILSVTSIMSFMSDQVWCISECLLADSFALVLVWSMIWVGVMMNVVPQDNSFPYVFSSLLISFVFYLSPDWLMFFIWFEVGMIPMFMLIVSHSSSAERMSASTFLFMYTTVASFPLLLFILSLKSELGSSSMFISLLPPLAGSCLLGCLAWTSFLVKLPLFAVHTWLLKAHVEAPVLGSMFLAGILLKFGGMGAFRLLGMSDQPVVISTLITSFCLWGCAISAILASSSPDVKMAVAYASVSHMNLSLAIGLSNSYQGLSSFLYSMVAHSFSSCLLFYSVTRCYEVVNSRSTVLLKGAMANSILGAYSGVVVWFMNLNIPPFMGLWGELWGFMVISKVIPLAIMSLFTYFVWSSVYSVVLFISQFHAKSKTSKLPCLSTDYYIQHLAGTAPMVVGFVSISVMEIS